MQNKELKSLVTKLYDNVLSLIDTQESTSKEQLVHYLQDAIKVVEGIKNEDIKSGKVLFENPYKEVATSSLSSYEKTNTKFKKISEIHRKTLDQCMSDQINLPLLTEKFSEIQQHMSDEVIKANQIISKLSTQVKELEKKSNIDGLTKILNRRALDTYLSQILQIPEKQNFHLLLLDVDNFKMVNDKHGHIAGDKILIYMANILKKALRGEDKIFRYGGEEFVIILHNVNNTTCLATSTRLLELVRESKLIYKGTNLSVTISMGTTPHHENDSPEMLLNRADKALYKAKRSGKDKICSEI